MPAARDVVLPLVRELHEVDQLSGEPRPKVILVERTFGLLPDPDNDYNPLAVAVVPPGPGTGDLDLLRQVAWVKDEHLRSLRPSIVGLMEATDEPVGCRVVMEVHRYVADVDYDRDEPIDSGFEDDRRVLTEAESRMYEYTFGGFRAKIDSWDVVTDAVLRFAHDRVSDRLLPLIGRRSPWSQDSKPLRHQMRAAGRTPVVLRADGGVLNALWGGSCVSRLHPHAGGYFSRTHQRVVELGGEAAAQAVAHAGSVEVFIEDSRP